MTINFVKIRKYAYIFSGIIITASIVGVFLFGLKPGMDFVGGSLLELNMGDSQATPEQINEILKSLDVNDAIITTSGESGLAIRAKEISEEKHQQILSKVKESFSSIEESRFESVGPAIGQELKKKSFSGVAFVILGIALYLTWAFRKVSRPMSSWKYGVVTIMALLHDVIIPIGLFSYLGHFLGWEVDSTFITALLVILGFSVHDTIVVLDRIRERLRTHPNTEFKDIVNQSINETLVRSINTSLTLVIVLVSLLVFGPVSLKVFVMTLLIGTVFGTYSSIFVASPLLLDWHNLMERKKIKK
ncbi:MAG: protein translocase subunit SecF [Patescibacteria group bacterium]|nr:protein translocase subunit SecF [Patescibacteria group bacterium]